MIEENEVDDKTNMQSLCQRKEKKNTDQKKNIAGSWRGQSGRETPSLQDASKQKKKRKTK